MSERSGRKLAGVRPVHPHQWLWEPLEADPTFMLRSMFGTKAAYLDGKLMLCFSASAEPWRGVLVCTERTHHPALCADFPVLAPHSVLPKWLYLPEAADNFEQIAAQLVSFARRRDPRLGVTPQAKRKKSPPKKNGASVNAPATPEATPMNVVHFARPAEFRAWLEKNHATATELQVGFYKKGAGKPGMTYREAVDEALCYGWIDGLIRRVDAESYTHRFTPRKDGSIWSNINIGHVARLTAAGRMQPAGLAAFNARSAAKTGVYSFERKQPAKLPSAFEKKFRANKPAWAFFNAQPPGYRRLALHFVVSAKQEATRLRRLERLVAESAAGQRVGLMG